jgi:tetratricopeptide (TPR) repeat protein
MTVRVSVVHKPGVYAISARYRHSRVYNRVEAFEAISDILAKEGKMAQVSMKDGVPLTPLEYEEFEGQLRLKCRTCGTKATYSVGRVFVNPNAMRRVFDGAAPYEEAVFFSGNFRCKKCGLGGPWDLPKVTQARLNILQMMAVKDPNSYAATAINLGELRLFDGTPCHSGGEGEAYIQGKIDADPGNFFLWSRLGNLHNIAEQPDRALPAFQKAVELNPHDVESHHSLGAIYHARGQLDEAAAQFHQVLLHARQAPQRTRNLGDMLKNIVRDTLERLLDLHEASGKRIEVLPAGAPGRPDNVDAKEAVVVLKTWDLSKESDWEQLTNTFCTRHPSPEPRHHPGVSVPPWAFGGRHYPARRTWAATILVRAAAARSSSTAATSSVFILPSDDSLACKRKAAALDLDFLAEILTGAATKTVGRVLSRLGPYRELGLSLEGRDHKQLQRDLAELIPPNLRYSLHVNLVMHGRTVCRSIGPLCERCELGTSAS